MINYKEIVDIIKKSKYMIAFTGAGISAESGVPTFRGKEGVWEKHGSQFAEIDYFLKDQEDSWKSLKKVFYEPLKDTKPNMAHIVLAKLERMGLLKAVITQNIDGLHQEAGNKIVYELHGTAKYAICMKCKTKYRMTEDILSLSPPKCEECGGILKPNFVFFGETLPSIELQNSMEDASKSDLCLIVGTGGEVMPAARIPYIAKQNKAKIIEINPKPSNYTDDIVDIYVEEKAGIAFSEMDKYL